MTENETHGFEKVEGDQSSTYWVKDEIFQVYRYGDIWVQAIADNIGRRTKTYLTRDEAFADEDFRSNV